MAEKNGTKFFSSSALRYASELDGLSATRVETTGGGGNIAEYIIHQAEMVIKTIKAKPISAKAENLDGKYIISANFEGGKKATLVYANPLPFTVTVTKEDGGEFYSEMKSPFFKGLISDILNFYETGEKSFESDETLKVMALRDLCLDAVENI